MKVTVCNIDWAIDDEDNATLPNLPTKAVVDGVTSSYDIADALSDKYGFLVNSFEYVDILQDLQNSVTNLEGGRHWGRVSDDIIRKYEEFEDEEARDYNNEKERLFAFAEKYHLSALFTQITDDSVFIVDNKGSEFLMCNGRILVSKGIYEKNVGEEVFCAADAFIAGTDEYDVQYIDCEGL